MGNNDYPFNLIRAIYGDGKTDNTHTETTYIKGLYEQLKTLNEKEQAVLSMRYKDGLTVKACAEYYGVTDSRMRQTVNQTMRKLRHPSRTRHYEAVPKIELQHLEGQYRRIDEKNQQLKETLHALGGCDIDPKAITLLANVLELQHLEAHVGELGLSTRALNGMRRAGILTIKDLIVAPEEKLSNLRNIGEKTMQEIRVKLRAHILLPDEHQSELEDIS